MIFKIENECMIVKFDTQGGELRSIFRKANQREYLWSGDPSWWPSQAPILFPFIARVKDGWYRYKGKPYPMSLHGFARWRQFVIDEMTDTRVVLTQRDDEATRTVYPFRFRLKLIYELNGEVLTQRFVVENHSDEEMLFCVGGHTGYMLPTEDGEKLEDIYLQFDTDKNLDRIDNDAAVYYLRSFTKDFIHGREKLFLKPELFKQDAFAFNDPSIKAVSILSVKSGHGVRVDVSEFPYLGVWQKPGAPYLCIEPWAGIADYADTTHDLETKDGVQRLAVGGTFEAAYYIELL